MPIFRRRLAACAILACAATGAMAAESWPTLACDVRANERVQLKQAPHGARRIGKHVLEVTTSKGPQRFADKQPYDMDEAIREYCGYSAQARAHLIGMSDAGGRSGELLFDDSGRRQPAGHTVVFAPAGQGYLAIEQEDGMDGETWTVRDAAGKTAWTGYAGVLAKKDDVETMVSTYERPRWNAQGRLTAHVACLSSKDGGTVELAPAAGGRWAWRGGGKC